jgi:hypothetical protein
MQKVCSECKIEKHIKEFHKRHNTKEKLELLNKKRDYRKKNKPSLKSLYSRYKYSAKRRQLSFYLTLEQFSSLFTENCKYCNKQSAYGIDRVNNAFGYEFDNCVPCCKDCNEMKMDRNVNDFYSHVIKIYTTITKS